MSFKSFQKFRILLASLPIIFFASCEKGEDKPINDKPLTYGFLSAILNEEKLINGTDTITVVNQMGYAVFLADPNVPNIFTEAGNVSLNDTALIKDANNKYLKVANNLNLNNTIKWKVSGAGNIPDFNVTDTVFFPSYNGAIPAFVDKNNGLNLLLDTATVKGADSVRIYIDDGGNNIVQKTFAATAGNVQIPPSELIMLNNVNNLTGYLGIYLYSGKLKAFSQKAFYFIRENRRGQSVNIY